MNYFLGTVDNSCIHILNECSVLESKKVTEDCVNFHLNHTCYL